MMKIFPLRIAALLLVGGFLSACETVNSAAESSTETLADWYGSAKEAIAGPDYDPNRNFIANQVGQDLDDSDAVAIERESVRALESAPDGKTLNWSNPNSGTSATITPAKTMIEKRGVTTQRSEQVASAPSLTLIGRTYRAVKNANVRAAPGTKHPIVGKLAKGSKITAIGKVDGSDWIMVGQNGLAVGYVFAPLVTPGKQGLPSLRKTLDEGDSAENALLASDGVSATTCRSVDYNVTLASGETSSDSFRACKAGDGAWEID